MTEPTASADVVVLGAGPVGLSAAIMLGQRGIATTVIERKLTVHSHPRAFGIHGRTMEVFRQWGIADAIRAGALEPERSQGFGWFASLLTPEIGALTFAGPAPTSAEPSPEPPCFCPQSHYEHLLLAAANEQASVTVLLDQNAIAVRQDADEVSVELQPPGSSTTDVIRAKYLLAADGAQSSTRGWLGISESGLDPFGHSLHIHFRADLAAYVADKPYMLMWILNQVTRGTLAVASKDYQEWTYNIPADTTHQLTHAELARLIRAAIGVPDLPLEIIDVLAWDYEQKVSDAWRSGRVFLLGDAAHRFPPHGAFGMNSGIQDAQNLAWKLALVLRRAAGDHLLATYETERKPVAELNGQQAVRNTRNLELVDGSTLDLSDLSTLESGHPGPLRDAFQQAIARQAGHLQSAGQQFGVRYQSAAVVSDGAAVVDSTISEYVESASPGSRAPHLWLSGRDGEVLSTIDLFGRGFVLLAASAGQAWIDGVKASTHSSTLGVVAHHVGPDGSLLERDRQFTAVYGLTESGAVIVRPDGHVLARFDSSVQDPASALNAALSQVVGDVAATGGLSNA